LRNTYIPLADVVVDRVPPRSEGLDISTVAPGSGAPSSLITVPVALPSRMACARTDLTETPTRRREKQIAVTETLPNRMAILLTFNPSSFVDVVGLSKNARIERTDSSR
jgi:hypothetical protein